MSERNHDDEYLWSGRGAAPGEVDKLEKLFGSEKLRAPLEARPRRRLPLAVAVAALTAGAVFLFSRKSDPPVAWTAAVLPNLSSADIEGGVYEFELVDESPPAGWQEAIEERLAGFPPHIIQFSGRRVLVDFAGAIPLELEDVVARRGEFAIHEVIESSPLMRALYTRVSAGDELASELGVTAGIDSWDHDESGRRFTDWYLTAPSAQVLDAYLRAVAVENPRLAPDDAHVFAFEPMRPEPGEDGPQRWRSYYLDRAVWLSNADIADAYVYWSRTTDRPEVLVEFHSAGAQRFADLTGRIVGRKLAMLLDGQVNSAPVVQDRITGGRTSITMGGGDPRTVQFEAQELVNLLRASQHPLPVALELLKLTIRRDELSEGQIRLARISLALLVGLIVLAVVLVAERTSRPIDPEVAPVRGRARRRSLPWLRFLVTAAGVAVVILADRIPVSRSADWSDLGQHVSLFALGIMPAISAFLLVELAALLVPRWRGLRRGGPSARGRLGSATAILTLLLALVQAWMVADFMLSVPMLAHLSRAMLVISLTAGALIMTFLALLMSRYGIANGFAALLLTGTGVVAYRAVRFLADGTGAATTILSFVIAIAATAIATSWILRYKVRGASPASSLRLPTAGVVPLALVPALMGLLALSWPEAAARVGIWWAENVARPGSGLLVEIGFLVTAGLALSWLFSRQVRLGNATAGAARPHGFIVATAISIGYLVLLALLQRWQAGVLGYFGIALSAVALVTALVMDIIAEWRALARRDDLVPIWPLHQVQRVELVTGALARNGIDVHARGLHLRLLLHFFGPFAPVLLYVPAEQADEARAIVRAQIEPR